MSCLRPSSSLRQLILLLWLGVVFAASAAPALSPASTTDLGICSSSDDGTDTLEADAAKASHTLSCALCLPAWATAPDSSPLALLQLPNALAPSVPAGLLAGATALPWQARAPPLIL